MIEGYGLVKNSRSDLGKQAERLAALWLQGQGLQLVDSNFSSRYGEIDLIMRDQTCLVFVEVRSRRFSPYGRAVDSIDRHKKSKIIATAAYFLQQTSDDHNDEIRFDVIGIDYEKASDMGNAIHFLSTGDAKVHQRTYAFHYLSMQLQWLVAAYDVE